MYGAHQKHALFFWFGLPHLLMWTGFFLTYTAFGYGSDFAPISPVLPLMIALLWSWEWRSGGIAISLVLLGLCLDFLNGTPLGLHSLLWMSAYWLLPFFVHDFNEDSPFISRLLASAFALGVVLLAELVLASIYGLSTSELFALVLRWLIMVCLMPLVSVFIYQSKKLFYRKLWAHLPEELRVGIR